MNDATGGPELGVGDSLRAYALYELDVAGRMLGREGAELHAGVHEARKALRHVRATLRLAAAALGDRGRAVLGELGELVRSLAAVRDAGGVVDAIEVLIGRTKGRDERIALGRVCRALIARRSAALGALLADDPALVQRRASLRRLRDDIAGLAWSEVTALAVGNALARSEKRAKRIGRRARDSGSGRRRHLWRRRLRRLRSQLRIVESELGWLLSTRGSWSWPDPTHGPSIAIIVAVRPRSLRAITDRLGLEHDLRLLADQLPGLKQVGPLDRRVARKRVRKAITALCR